MRLKLPKLIEAKKAQIFVAHIQLELKYGGLDSIFMGYVKIPRGKVGCKLCDKSIDKIWNEYQRRSGWAKNL